MDCPRTAIQQLAAARLTEARDLILGSIIYPNDVYTSGYIPWVRVLIWEGIGRQDPHRTAQLVDSFVEIVYDEAWDRHFENLNGVPAAVSPPHRRRSSVARRRSSVASGEDIEYESRSIVERRRDSDTECGGCPRDHPPGGCPRDPTPDHRRRSLPSGEDIEYTNISPRQLQRELDESHDTECGWFWPRALFYELDTSEDRRLSQLANEILEEISQPSDVFTARPREVIERLLWEFPCRFDCGISSGLVRDWLLRLYNRAVARASTVVDGDSTDAGRTLGSTR
eukprot:GHVU01234341.1.p1 GENE.GHVU01234341.1~~GHVU01234341.1.p1  ORF type:complete len:283 (+),score=15.91 GHVU01234341.1:524-1372(+)